MIVAFIAVLGLALGSFVNALVWRMFEGEQIDSSSFESEPEGSSLRVEDKKQIDDRKKGDKRQKAKDGFVVRASSIVKRKKSTTNDQRLTSHDTLSIWKGRSMCPDCRHTLAARDLVPVFSWLLLRGKCRYCQQPIAAWYPLFELLTAALFIAAYIFWPYPLETGLNYLLFAICYLLITTGVALAQYDLRWMILPNRLVYVFNGLGLAFLAVYSLMSHSWPLLTSGLIGGIVFSGFFYLMYQISGGKWIGGGDVRLALGLGLILGWQKSLLGLTLAAYLGTLVILVLVIARRYYRKMKLPFGPLLLAGTYGALLFGDLLINWYLRASGV